jgi:hypothetical protein
MRYVPAGSVRITSPAVDVHPGNPARSKSSDPSGRSTRTRKSYSPVPASITPMVKRTDAESMVMSIDAGAMVSDVSSGGVTSVVVRSAVIVLGSPSSVSCPPYRSR